MRAGNYSSYAVTILEESDFTNGHLNADKVYGQFIEQVGTWALGVDGLREEFLRGLDGARVGDSRDVSFLYNVAYGYSAAQAQAAATRQAPNIPIVRHFSETANLAGQGMVGAAPSGYALDYSVQLGVDTLGAVSAGLGIYRVGAGVVSEINAIRAYRATGQLASARGTDLARLAMDYRLAEKVSGARNVAVFEYRAADGTLKTIARTSGRGVGHAERIIARELEAAGVDPSRVTRIYSELQPCSVPGGYCADFIKQTFPQARVTYSYEYGATPASRAAGTSALREEAASAAAKAGK
jgi:hypothetical protein